MIPIHKKGSRRKSEGPGAPQVYIHGKVQGWAIWALAFRRFKTQFSSQYAGTVIGKFWHLVQPLSMVGIYTLVFGLILQVRPNVQGVPYGVYLCAGLIPWFAFQDSIVKLSIAYTSNRQFLKRIFVAEEIFILERLIHISITLAVSFIAVAGVSLLFGVSAGVSWLLLIVILSMLLVCAGGIGWGLAFVTPFFADLIHIIQIALRPMFWLTPVIYPLSQVQNPVLSTVVYAQPMTPFVVSIRAILFEDQIPCLELWVLMSFWCLASISFGYFVKRLLGDQLRDVI